MQEPCKKSYCHDEGYNVQFLLQLFQKGVDSMPFLKREFVVGLYCIIPRGVFHICPMLVYIDWVDKILETHLRNKKKPNLNITTFMKVYWRGIVLDWISFS